METQTKEGFRVHQYDCKSQYDFIYGVLGNGRIVELPHLTLFVKRLMAHDILVVDFVEARMEYANAPKEEKRYISAHSLIAQAVQIIHRAYKEKKKRKEWYLH